MAQLYVMVPGRDQPELLEVEEVVRRIQAGELPEGASVARLGETTWLPVVELPEVRGARGAASHAFASSEAMPPAPNAGSPATPSATPGPTRKPGVSRGVLLGSAGAGLGLLVVLAIAWVFYRNSYARGLVLEHLPDDCAEFYYVDAAGLLTSEPVRNHLEKFLKNSRELAEEEVTSKSKKEKERVQKALDALERSGVTATTVREVAVCIPAVDREEKGSARDKALLVVGGTFRKGDILQGLKEAFEAVVRDEDACKIEDDDVRLLKCSGEFKGSKKEPVYAGLVDSRVLAIGLDKKTVKSLRSAKDRSKTYGADKGEHVVLARAKEQPSWDGSFGSSKLSVGATDTKLVIETHFDPEKGKKKLEQFKDGDELVKKREKGLKNAANTCFEKSPFDMLSESVERTKVEAFDDGVRYEWKVSNKDLGKAFKVLSDADKEDMSKLFRVWMCIGNAVEPYVSTF